MVSNIGMWMQQVAQGWLIVTLTSSEFLIGLVGFCAMAPNLFLALLGGVVADRRDKRTVLIVAQILNTLLIAALGVLIWTETVELWHVMALSAGMGTVMALTAPSWQSLVPELIGKQNMMNAVAINSAQFNLTRVVGPSIGGFMIRAVGVAGCYFANALTNLVFLAALLFIKPKYAPTKKAVPTESLMTSMKAAVKYAWDHPVLRTILGLAVVQTVFLFPYATLLPVFAKDVLGMDAGGFSLLLSAGGVGALAGALMLAFRSKHVKSKGRLMLLCQVIFGIGVTVFAFSSWLPLSLAALFFIGWALVSFLATGNTIVQTIVPDALRGRVMSIWMLAGFGLMPIGSLQVGTVASLTSPTTALVAGAVITLAYTAWVALRQWDLFKPGAGLSHEQAVMLGEEEA